MIGKVVILLALVGVTMASWNLYQSSQSYHVQAYFASADQLVPGNDVTVAGVPAGKVVGVELAPEDSGAGALVTLQINRRYAPLRRGTRASIRPKGLLGTKYVELAPATTGEPLPSGGTIPLQDTAAPVTFDQITDVFDPQTRAWAQTLTREGGTALAERGEDVNGLLSRLPRISADAAATTAALDARQQQIDQLQVEFDRVAAMISSEDRALRRDLESGALLLDTVAAHQRALQDEIVHAERALQELNAALDGHSQDLNRLLKELPMLLDDLRAVQSDSAVAFSIVDPCIDDIVTTLAEMRSASAYRDAGGYMLRVQAPLPAPPSTGSYAPTVPCTGPAGGR